MLLCVLAFVLFFSVSSYGSKIVEAKNSLSSETNSYIVGFNKKVDKSFVKGKIKKEFDILPIVTMELTNEQVLELSNNSNISYIEQDYSVKASGQILSWGVPYTNAIDVQSMGITGNGVKIGILDTGIDYTHEDLNVLGGVSFIEGSQSYFDDNGHGTHVAGIIGSLNNHLGVLGISPQADLYAIKVLDGDGNGNYSDIIAGIEWAIDNDMDILNMSLGGDSKSRALKEAVNLAYEAGILLIAAAGNDGSAKKSTVDYPAEYKSVIAVGAIDEDNERATFSSVGKSLELMAPGVNIFSTLPGGYGVEEGTSFAAPYVTGIAALLIEHNSSLKNTEVREALNNTAIRLGEDFYYGNGLINVLDALEYSTKKGKLQ